MRSLKEIKQDLLGPKGEQNLYQALEHPDFTDWTCDQVCDERWDMIRKNLDLSLKGTCLDIGCHTGWFCRAFSRVGWKTLGVDYKPLMIEIASEHMRGYEGALPVEYQLGDFRGMELPFVDVLLCLSLAMYLFPTGEDQGILRSLSHLSPTMFFDSGGMYADQMPFAPEDAGQYLVEHTNYNWWKLLGQTCMGRPFFLLRKR